MDSPGTAVAKVIADYLRTVVEVDDELVESVATKQPHYVFEERSATDGDHGFGHRVGERPEPFTPSCGEDHGLHSTHPPLAADTVRIIPSDFIRRSLSAWKFCLAIDP